MTKSLNLASQNMAFEQRCWVKVRGGILGLLAILCVFPIVAQGGLKTSRQSEMPNILWLTAEDHGPNLGCYGDRVARTPRLDQLAREGMLYRTAWSNAPVCAPARTTIISGCYAPSMGAEHMRSLVSVPELIQPLPVYLKQAGYYCTNNSKEDYNIKTEPSIWDASSNKAHWKNRPDGVPFFAVFNYTKTHESQIRDPKYKPETELSKIELPEFHPDAREVRRDWAEYYDRLHQLDGYVAERLQELEDEGVAENTIVLFFADHGSGMPGFKRACKNTGLRVPMIVYFPEKYRHLASEEYGPGVESERLVSFVDLIPTMLSIVGAEIPEYLQGFAFLGPKCAPMQPYLYGFRSRMDERYDFVRGVRDQRFSYVRNYYPHLPEQQHVAYQFMTPTTVVWKTKFDEGTLTEAQQSRWVSPRTSEELYDLENDPDEVHNLAELPEYRETVDRFRRANWEHLLRIRDLGFLPESIMLSRSASSTPYEYGHDAAAYPMMDIMPLAVAASHYEDSQEDVVMLLKNALHSGDAVQRYWGLVGFQVRGDELLRGHLAEIETLMSDETPVVAMLASYLVLKLNPENDRGWEVLESHVGIDPHGIGVAMEAVNYLDLLPAIRQSAAQKVAAVNAAKQNDRMGNSKRYDSMYQKMQDAIAEKPLISE